MLAPFPHESTMPLDMLRCNEQARVVDLLGSETQIHRLAEMGLCTGAEIRMVKPGSPCVLALDGKRLSLRLTPDVDILVAPIAF